MPVSMLLLFPPGWNADVMAAAGAVIWDPEVNLGTEAMPDRGTG